MRFRILFVTFILAEIVNLAESQCRRCDQSITGRDMLYSRAVEIVQEEEYLDESDFDEIRLRYKRNIQVNNHNELMTSKKRIRRKRQSEVVTNGECPSGWLNAGELGGCYLFAPTGPGLDFYQAKDFCVSVGGYLTDILNQETQDFLDNSGFRQSYPAISWWVGGCDNAIEGQFVWISGEPFVFTDWSAGQPDNFGGAGEMCIHIRNLGFAPNAQWNDISCTATTDFRPICKQEQTTIIDSAMETVSDTLEDFLDTVLENAPTAAAVGGAAASTALVMNPSLPMTMASGVPPGNPPPGTPGGGAPPNGAPQTTLNLVPAGLNAVAVFPPFETARSLPAVAVIFSEDPSIGATSRVRRSLFRSARTFFTRSRRYLDSKLAMMKYAIQDFIQTLKREATIQNLKSKVQDKMDNVACLQTRLEYYAKESRKRKKYGYGGTSGQFNYLSDHILVKRAIDSMDDCFDFIEEPLYGFRVNVTQEIQCSELGPDCGLNENSRLTNNAIDRWQRNSSKNPIRKEDQFDVRQTGENFRSDAPPDCRIVDCS